MTVQIREIDVREAGRLADAGAFLLDVREDDEWAAGHAPTATHLPLGRLGDIASVASPSTPIVAICRSGNRSGRATEALTAAGYDVVNMAGGMTAWAAAGQPVVGGNGAAGTVI
ncbi:MAG: rhodanese-like domain-containing protein [Acidimicrobiia bacterium]